jgi:hypothetical protein
MSEKICGTCRHYRPAEEFAEWGLCEEPTLWAARSQEVLGDLHACAQLGSRWEPLTGSATSEVAPSVADRAAVPDWIPWFRWIGGVGLLLSPVVFFVDLFVGIPGVPELFLLWFLASVAAALVGFLWGKF